MHRIVQKSQANAWLPEYYKLSDLPVMTTQRNTKDCHYALWVWKLFFSCNRCTEHTAFSCYNNNQIQLLDYRDTLPR